AYIQFPRDLASADPGHASNIEPFKLDNAGYVDGASDINLFVFGGSLDFERSAYVHFLSGDGSSSLKDTSYIKIVGPSVSAYPQSFVDSNRGRLEGPIDR